MTITVPFDVSDLPDRPDDDDPTPADGFTQTFTCDHARRVSVSRFTLYCDPPQLITAYPSRMWQVFDTLSDWQLSETRTFDPPLTVTAEWQDGAWVVTELTR